MIAAGVEIQSAPLMPEPIPTQPRSPRNRAITRLGRSLTWPVRRLLDPRFGGLSQQISVTHEDAVRRFEATLGQLAAIRAQGDSSLQRHDQSLQQHAAQLEALQRLHDLVMHQSEAAMEATAIFGRSLADLLEASGADSRVDAGERKNFRRLVGGALSDVDDDAARFLNYAGSHRGFAAQGDLWFNPPISLEYKPGTVVVSSVNERIAELPYVLRAFASLRRGARILDVGAAESTLAVSLASLGYRTTALDVRGYPLSHPLLEVVVASIEDWDHDQPPFEAAVCLSTIEHVGLGAYGDAKGDQAADRHAMRRIGELLLPRGLLVLTTPLGEAVVGETERTYDRAGLEALFDGWDVEDLTVVQQREPTVWAVVEADAPQHDSDKRHVALVTARKRS